MSEFKNVNTREKFTLMNSKSSQSDSSNGKCKKVMRNK